MKTITKISRGFALLIFILFVTIIGVVGLIFINMLKSSPDADITGEEPRQFNMEVSQDPVDDQYKITQSPVSTNTNSLAPTNGQTLNEKKVLKISSLGNVDLGGGFTANLKSAWELNNYINAEVVLKNGYTSALGVNAREFTLEGDGVVKKPTSSEEVDLNPGESKTFTLTFKIIPSSPYILTYDNLTSHISSDLGIIYME